MVKKIPEHFFIEKTIPEQDIPDITKYTFNRLKQKFGYSCRMSDFPIVLPMCYNSDGFELFDPKTWNSAQFLSYLLDQQIKFMNGEKIDLAQLHRDILKVYDFTKKEKLLFLQEPLEERLWSLFLLLLDPSHSDYIIK